MLVRLRFSKTGKLRWTSARDLARIWERAFRRAGTPLVYTGGFSPRPKVSFGLALPTGAESRAEYLDVELSREFDIGSLPAALSSVLPLGIDCTAAHLPTGSQSLQEQVTSCRWELEVEGVPAAEVANAVKRALAADSIPVVRQRKSRDVSDDLKPAIVSLEAASLGPNLSRVDAVLHTQPRGVRPSELVRALGGDLELVRSTRTHQWIERDGARREPIPLDATDPRHALERVS